jgi:hypothetical protein
MFKRVSNIQIELGVILIVGLCLLGLESGFAGENRAMSGWELNSPYNKLYKASEMDSFKGTVVDIKEVVPLPGMSPGLALDVSESKGETITVHLCPTSFENKKNLRIKKGDYSLKVRLTKDGAPFWTMTPSQLAKERQDQ